MKIEADYKNIDRWETTNIISSETAARLRAELDSRPVTFGLATTLSLIGAILVGAAIITFVAANWQEMPRLYRVALLCLAILLGYGVGGWCYMRRNRILSESFFLIGALSFGAGIALVGQMYHLSGTEQDALGLWCLGTGCAAFLLRSRVLTALTVLLATCFTTLSIYEYESDSNFFIIAENTILLLGAYGLCLWTGGRWARHIWMLYLAVFIVGLFIINGVTANSGYYIAAIFIVLFFIDWLMPKFINKIFNFSGPFGDWSLVFAFVFLGMKQFEASWRPMYALTTHKTVMAATIFLLCLIALWSSRKRGWSTRLIALAAIAAEIYYLIWKTINSLLTQSVFFFITAVVFFVMARIALRHKEEE